MAAIPVWLTSGGGPFTAIIVPQTVSTTDGTLSDGTTVALTGVLDDIEFSNNPILENIRPMSSTKANHVLIEDNVSMTLVEIMKSVGTNILAAQNAAAGVFKVTFTRGAQAYVYYGRRGAYNERVANGKSVTRLTLEQVDAGGYTYT